MTPRTGLSDSRWLGLWLLRSEIYCSSAWSSRTRRTMPGSSPPRYRLRGLDLLSSAVSGPSELAASESQSCSNEICSTSTPSRRTRKTAGKSIRRSRCSRRRGQPEARSTGGCGSAGSGWVGYEVQTVIRGGSRLLIFAQPKRSHDLSMSEESDIASHIVAALITS